MRSKIRKELRKLSEKIRNNSQKEYRGLIYTKEFKEDFEGFVGLKLKRTIDRYLDEKVSRIIFESLKYKHIITLEMDENNLIKLNSYNELKNELNK
jgi:hypothetical protein